MKLVIEMPTEQYKRIVKAPRCVDFNEAVEDRNILVKAIQNGTPLPKGHGKLVDVNSIPEEDRTITVKSLLYPGTIAYAGAINLGEYVNNLPTIVEADAESEEE